MPLALLPATAAAHTPRTAPNVVLNSRVETWLTQTLKRVSRVKRPLNSVPQHHRCLTDILSGPDAIWMLASLMVPKAPDAELRKDPNLLIEALFNYQLIHIEAYVVHVDMVSQHEVAFKLTEDTIAALIEYHKDIYSVDVSANTWDWAEKDAQLKRLQGDFAQAVNRYVFRTSARALEGLEDEGAGELLEGRSADVKAGIMGLFQPLLPPPPRVVDMVAPPPFGASHGPGNWLYPPPTSAPQPQQQLQHQLYQAQQQQPHHLNPPIDPWRVIGSTPSPTSSHPDSIPSTSWSAGPFRETHLPSPTPSFSQPCGTTAQFSHSPEAMSSGPTLPLPSVLANQCGTAAGAGYGGFAWSYSDMAPQYPIHT